MIETLLNPSFSVILCTYISVGLIFIPKITYIYRVPFANDDTNGNGGDIGGGSIYSRSKLSKAERSRYEQLISENDELKKQIEIVNIHFTRLDTYRVCCREKQRLPNANRNSIND